MLPPLVISADLSGMERVDAALIRLLPELDAAIFRATELSTVLTKDAIVAGTPERTGKLARSVVSVVTKLSSGWQGRISSDLRYTRYVNYGTAKHGRAQRMFERGVVASETDVQAFYRDAVERVASST